MKSIDPIFDENSPQQNHKGGGFGFIFIIIIVVTGFLLLLKYFIG